MDEVVTKAIFTPPSHDDKSAFVYAPARQRKGAPTEHEHKQTGMNGPAPFTPVFVVRVGYLLMAARTSGMGLIFY